MTEKLIGLTLEEIKSQFAPKEERFSGGAYKGKQVVASVSRNEQGVIVYVVPGSTRFVNEDQSEISFTPRRFRPATFDCALPPIRPEVSNP